MKKKNLFSLFFPLKYWAKENIRKRIGPAKYVSFPENRYT